VLLFAEQAGLILQQHATPMEFHASVVHGYALPLAYASAHPSLHSWVLPVAADAAVRALDAVTAPDFQAAADPTVSPEASPVAGVRPACAHMLWAAQ
jgi:hypothetical protein